MQHLVVAFLDACADAGSKVTRVRLQCRQGEKDVGSGRSISLRDTVYAPMAIAKDWVAPATEPWAGVGLREEDKKEFIMLWGKGSEVRKAAAALAASKPLAEGVRVSTHLVDANVIKKGCVVTPSPDSHPHPTRGSGFGLTEDTGGRGTTSLHMVPTCGGGPCVGVNRTLNRGTSLTFEYLPHAYRYVW